MSSALNSSSFLKTTRDTNSRRRPEGPLTLRYAPFLVLAVALAACGSSGSGTVAGNLNGAAFDTKDALSFETNLGVNGQTFFTDLIILTDFSGACGAHENRANASTLTLEIVNDAAVGNGTFTVGTATAEQTVSATYGKTNATCGPGDSEVASSGNVVLTSSSTQTPTGTFDLTFPSGDHVTGSFSAPDCFSGASGLFASDAGGNNNPEDAGCE